MSEFWDQRYAGETYAYGVEPNRFLRTQRHRLPERGRCLAVGGGEGRNGVWLVEQGFDVLSVDASAVGLQTARALAQARGVKQCTARSNPAAYRSSRPSRPSSCSIEAAAHLSPRCSILRRCCAQISRTTELSSCWKK